MSIRTLVEQQRRTRQFALGAFGYALCALGLIISLSTLAVGAGVQGLMSAAVLDGALALVGELDTNVAGTTSSTDTVTTTTLTTTKPAVHFLVPPVLSETHAVTITADVGVKIIAAARNKAVGFEQLLPVMKVESEQKSWTFQVEASMLPPGEYRILARVTHDGRVYEYASDVVVVPDTAVDETDEVTTGTTAATVSDDDTAMDTDEDEVLMAEAADTVSTPVVSFATVPAVWLGVREFVLTATGVERLQVLVRGSDGKVVRELSPQWSEGGQMKFLLDTKGLVGTYQLIARYTVAGTVQRTEGPRFMVGSTTVATTTPVDTAVSTTTTAESLVPPVLRLNSDTTDRYRTVIISGTAQFFELYLTPGTVLEPRFHGLAKQVGVGEWRYTIDTAALPQGSYQLSARYKQAGVLQTVTGPSFTVAAPAIVVKELASTTVAATAKIAPVIEESKRIIASTSSVAPAVVDTSAFGTTTTPTRAPLSATLREVPTLVTVHQAAIEAAINRYTTALRTGDAAAMTQTKAALTSLHKQLAEADTDANTVEAATAVAEHLMDLAERAERVETLVRERTAGEIARDSDRDGVTDYDEVTLYGTAPENPDTDNDGFTDGAEVLAGYNPLDAKREAVFAFESPKDTGVVRDDILVVENVAAIDEGATPDSDGVAAQAQISGRGLPNSFVTLYVFSTPVIVTLKTADDGSWVYKFDKELEDGEHEVYVGITDNTGTIVAKSSPFRFVKEAEAFTPSDVLATPAAAPVPSTFALPFVQLLIFGVIVMIIGFLLLMLGYQLDKSARRRSSLV